MSWQGIGAVGEMLAALGVIISLVYLAAQIRQNTASLRLASHQQFTQLSFLLNLALGTMPEVARIYASGLKSHYVTENMT